MAAFEVSVNKEATCGSPFDFLRSLVSRLGAPSPSSRLGLWPLAPLASRLGLRRLGLWPLAARLGLRPLTSRLGLQPLDSRLGLRFLACLWQLETGESFLAFLFSGIVWVNVDDDG